MMESIVYRTRHTSVSAVNYGFLYGYGHCKRSSRRSPDTLVNDPCDHQWVRYRARAGGARGRGRCRSDGRAQPRAAWATAEPTGRTPSSDGAHDEKGGFPIRARLYLA